VSKRKTAFFISALGRYGASAICCGLSRNYYGEGVTTIARNDGHKRFGRGGQRTIRGIIAARGQLTVIDDYVSVDKRFREWVAEEFPQLVRVVRRLDMRKPDKPIKAIKATKSTNNDNKGANKVKYGKVKWFDAKKGYGFISGVHFTGINGDGYRTLEDGQRVSFDAKITDRGLAAVNVSPIIEG